MPSAILKYSGSIVQWIGYVKIEETGIGITNFLVLQLWRQNQEDKANRIDSTLESYLFTVNISPPLSVQAGDVIGFFLPRQDKPNKPMEPLCYNSTSNDAIFYTHSSFSKRINDTILLCDDSLSRLDNMQIQIQPVYSKLIHAAWGILMCYCGGNYIYTELASGSTFK